MSSYEIDSVSKLDSADRREGELLHIQLRRGTALFDRAELDGGPGGFPVYGKVVLIMEGSLFR
jgi:hypothetical protein